MREHLNAALFASQNDACRRRHTLDSEFFLRAQPPALMLAVALKCVKGPIMLTISCPRCSKKLKGPDELQGKSVKCGKCGHKFQVQAVAASDFIPLDPAQCRY